MNQPYEPLIDPTKAREISQEICQMYDPTGKGFIDEEGIR